MQAAKGSPARYVCTADRKPLLGLLPPKYPFSIGCSSYLRKTVCRTTMHKAIGRVVALALCQPC
jgi:hypothetical protein